MIGVLLDRYGEWSELELQFLLRLCPPGGTVVDVGAHIGTFTVPFAKAVGDSGSVVAVEAQRLVFQNLVTNVFINQLSNVILHNSICSRQPYFLRIVEQPLDRTINSGALSIPIGPRKERSWRSTRAEPLDDILAGLDRLDLIKIDVEGFEAEVLAGGEATLRRVRPVIHCECLSQETFAVLARFAGDNGFTLFGASFSAFNPDNAFGGAEIDGMSAQSDPNVLLWPTERPIPHGLTLTPVERQSDLNLRTSPVWL